LFYTPDPIPVEKAWSITILAKAWKTSSNARDHLIAFPDFKGRYRIQKNEECEQ
jgi:transposase